MDVETERILILPENPTDTPGSIEAWRYQNPRENLHAVTTEISVLQCTEPAHATTGNGEIAPNHAIKLSENDLILTELYAQHYYGLVRLAAFLVRDTPTAEEVVQDSFVALRDKIEDLRDPDKGPAYLKASIINRSRSVLRHRVVVDKNREQAPPNMPSAESDAMRSIEQSIVIAALRELTARQREAVVLQYYAELSEKDIAKAMNISRGAVKSHTHRGMKALKIALEKAGIECYG
jgi:RNA polymerase sigma-70 factor (sigma-E family)